MTFVFTNAPIYHDLKKKKNIKNFYLIPNFDFVHVYNHLHFGKNYSFRE